MYVVARQLLWPACCLINECYSWFACRFLRPVIMTWPPRRPRHDRQICANAPAPDPAPASQPVAHPRTGLGHKQPGCHPPSHGPAGSQYINVDFQPLTCHCAQHGPEAMGSMLPLESHVAQRLAKRIPVKVGVAPLSHSRKDLHATTILAHFIQHFHSLLRQADHMFNPGFTWRSVPTDAGRTYLPASGTAPSIASYR